MRKKSKATSITAAKGRGQKRLASSISTSNFGGSYEARVQASYLLAMFAGSSTAVLPDAAVVELRFQGRIHRYNTDDLICTLRLDDGSTRKALLQAKLTLNAVPSDSPFSESIIAAWYDYQDPSLFQRRRDQLVIAYSRDAGNIDTASQLTRFARGSLTSAEFVRKATAEGFSSKEQRKVFEGIKAVLAKELGRETDGDELHDFLRHLYFVRHDVAVDETPEVANILSFIKLVLGTELGGNPSSIWALLTVKCQSLNKDAASLSFENLDEQLSPKLATAFAAHRKSPAARIRVNPESGVGTAPSFAEESRNQIRTLSVTPVRRASQSFEDIGLSAGRADSANPVITRQLDAINEKLKQFRYQDALGDVTALGGDLGPFDSHQKARWYLQRGVCKWHLGDANAAAEDFLRAAALSPYDDRMAAAGIRGQLLGNDVPGALASGKVAAERFPESLPVWTAYANARMMDGQRLSLSDIPAAHRAAADPLQMVAASLNHAGDRSGAVTVSLQSLASANAGFYTRQAALSTVLEAATSDPVLSTFRLIAEQTKAALHEVTAAFAPRTTRLWSVQAPDPVAGAAANLGLALLLQGKPEDALAFVHEARAHDVQPPDLLRVELEALQQTGKTPEMLNRGRALLPQLREDALVWLAQAAANVGDVALVSNSLEAAIRLPDPAADLLDALRALRWLAMWNAGDKEPVEVEARAADFASTSSLPLVVVGARVLRRSDLTAAGLALARAEQLVAVDPSSDKTLLLADLLFDTKEFAKAARLYEKVLPPGLLSDAHTRLLRAYVRSGSRHKAKKLIEGFPDGWVRDDNARALAIELGQNVGDWPLLKKLAEAQFSKEPNQVRGWLFKFMVAVRELPVAELQQWLSRAPLDLLGSIHETTQLAAQELRYGLQHKGMQRMYRLRRLKANDIESASAMVLSFVAVPGRLPNMEEALPVVAEGTHFVLAGGGDRIHVTLDPAEVGELPADAECRSAREASVAQLMGKKVGDEVVLEGSYQTRRVLRIESIDSAYRRLLDLAGLQMDRSLEPVPSAASIRIGTSVDGEPDFSAVHEQLKMRHAHVNEAFRIYSTTPITLGGFGRLVGKDPVDVVWGWPTSPEASPLFVTVGTVDERQAALAQVGEATARYVIDAATVAELSLLEALDALRVLPKVYVTSETRDILRRRLEEARFERTASGTLLDDDGRMRLVELSDKDHERARRASQAMVDTVESVCEVLPSYGPETNTELLVQLEKVTSEEEHAVLRLAAEHNLCLVTVDGRLRNVAALVNIRGVPLQVVMMHAADTGKLTPRAYCYATVRMFMSNRWFVSLGSHDLLLMCHQGTQWARLGITRYKRYLANPGTEFQSALDATLRFVREAAAACTTLAALAELLRHLVEGLARHKDCRDDLLDRLQHFVDLLLGPDSPFPYPLLKVVEKAKKLEVREYLVGAILEGQRWASEPVQDRPVHIKVYAVGRTPHMVGSSADDDGVAVVAPEPVVDAKVSTSASG